MPQPSPSFTFTTVAVGGLLNVLKNKCSISSAFSSIGIPTPTVQFDVIWDTGATNSVISQSVVDACGLVPTSMTQVHGVNGPHMAEVYVVNILLPNNVTFSAVKVTKGTLLGAQALIGMDIINQGDFAVTNKGGITKFSFRMPSEVHIDFVQEFNLKAKKARFSHGGTSKPRSNKPKTFGKHKKK